MNKSDKVKFILSGLTTIVIFIIACILFYRKKIYEPTSVSEILIKAGRNADELRKVIQYCKASGDEQKLKAAYFLISNMDNKYGHIGTFPSNYYCVFKNIHRLEGDNLDRDSIKKLIGKQWDSVELRSGRFSYLNYPLISDYKTIKANFLIENINLAFKAWREKPWSKHVNFEEFCQYILPYRIYDEPLQSFRAQYLKDFSWLEDSLKNKTDPKEACLLINGFLASRFIFSYQFEKCPMISSIDLYHLFAGDCQHRYILVTTIMRSLGIPIAIEFSPQYNDISGSHYWLTVLDNNKVFRPFNGGEIFPFFQNKNRYTFPDSAFVPLGNGKSTKVYRTLFGRIPSLDNSKKNIELPKIHNYLNLEDVTANYAFSKSNIKISLNRPKSEKNPYCYLCCFGESYPLVPIDYVKDSSDTVEFRNLGCSAVYLACNNVDDSMQVLSDPYYIDDVSKVHILKPNFNKMETVKLFRKFPCFDLLFPNKMMGAKFQSSKNKMFNHPVTFLKIDSPYTVFMEKIVNIKSKYQYYRYLASDSSTMNIAEVDFMKSAINYTSYKNNIYKIYGYIPMKKFTPNSEFKNAFDGDISTNLNAPPKSWVAIDFRVPVKIKKIRFCVRNDLNIIEVGDKYELLYFNMGWVSAGIQIAKKNYLIFENIPDNSLLLVRDLTKGNEERIFMYQNGTQKWL